MAPAPAPRSITEPFAISCIAGRYLLFDVDIVAHCRRAHNICGVLIGTIPNLSQQNVFLGIPLELMPEEARVLIERGAAYVVDDVAAHRDRFQEMTREERLKYLQEMDRMGESVARQHLEKAEQRKDKALKEKGLRKEVPEQQRVSSAESTFSEDTLQADECSIASSDLGFIMKGSSFMDSAVWVKRPVADEPPVDHALFESTSALSAKPVIVQSHYVTPTTSYSPPAAPSEDMSLGLPRVPNSYPLFRYLHSQGYFHMPGLRFGCHYNVYPGDPLRYHSHFAATGLAWDQEFELLDVVGGGRLGTGTKKAYMIGGEDTEARGHGEGLFSDKTENKEPVRAFSIEWAAL